MLALLEIGRLACDAVHEASLSLCGSVAPFREAKVALEPLDPNTEEEDEPTVKHLALRAQAIALRHQVVNLLASLQHALDGLVQHDLRLIELLLDLHDAVCLMRVLILHDVILERGECQRGRRGRKGGTRVHGEELVDDLGEELVRDQRGVIVVADDDAGDALGAAVGMEGVVLLLDILSAGA